MNTLKNSLEKCVELVIDLPNLIIQNYQIVLENNNQEKIFFKHKQAYFWVGKWLEYYLINRRDYLPELRFHQMAKVYKVRAEFDLAIFKLTQEVLASNQSDTSWQKYTKYVFDDDPILWWFCIEWEKCEKTLQDTGLLGMPYPIGKTEFVNNATSLYKALEEPRKFKSIQLSANNITPFSALFHMAGLISQLDDRFYNIHFTDFLNKFKKYKNHIKRNPQFKALFLLSDNSLEITGMKHRKIPKNPYVL